MEVANFLVTILAYVSFFYVIFRKKFRACSWKKVICAAVIVLIYICGIIGAWSPLLFFASGFCILPLMYLIFEISIAETIKEYLVALPAMLILVFTAYGVLYDLKVEVSGNMIQSSLCVIIGLWLYYIFLGRKLDQDGFDMPGLLWIVISGVLFLLMVLILGFQYILMKIEGSRSGEIGVVLITLSGPAMFVLIYIMLYHFNIKQKYQLQTELLTHYNEQQKAYFEQLLQKEQSTRQFRHDMISELLQMQNFCHKKEYDDLENYLSEMLDDISKISKNDYNVGNEIINTLINHYFHPIREACEIKVSGFVDDEINIAQRDLCIVISNLVKNAVEAMEQCQSDSKEIIFEVKQGKQFLHIMVKNTADYKKLVLKNNFPVTTKKDRKIHGIGLANIVKVAEKYSGKYAYTIENGYYIAEVHLQI